MFWGKKPDGHEDMQAFPVQSTATHGFSWESNQSTAQASTQTIHGDIQITRNNIALFSYLSKTLIAIENICFTAAVATKVVRNSWYYYSYSINNVNTNARKEHINACSTHTHTHSHTRTHTHTPHTYSKKHSSNLLLFPNIQPPGRTYPPGVCINLSFFLIQPPSRTFR